MIDRGLALESDAVILLFFQCLIKAYAGLYSEALETGQRLLKLSPLLPGLISTYAYVCACAGLKQEALQYIDLAQNQHPFPGKSLMVPTFLVLGDYDSAITWLEQAAVESDIWLSLVKIDPRIDAIRLHHRVQKVMHQMDTI
jgi:tetratricopeptide (TPR) repeat protein